MSSVLGLPLLLILVIGVVFLVMRRGPQTRDPGAGDGEDLLGYLILAVAVGVATFSLMNLGRAAFPAGSFVTNPEGRVATSLAGLVVSIPFVIFLWGRQRQRRDLFPRSGGWTLYLALIEAVFMTMLAVSLYGLFDWWLGTGPRVHFTDVLVYGGLLAFHELAVRVTPPRSGGFELPRVIGSAIGLGMLTFGAIGLLTQVFDRLFGYVSAADWGPGLALVITGALVWGWRWLRPWPEPAGHARLGWTFLVAAFNLGALLGATAYIIARGLAYLLTSTPTARIFFGFLTATTALALVTGASWIHHRWKLGRERTDPVRAYEYLTAAQGLSTAVASTTALIAITFSRRTFAGDNTSAAITAGVYLLIGLGVWYFFWQRAQAQPRETEVGAAPRRTYLLGLGVVMAITSAIALIVSLIGVFQLILGVGSLSDEFPTTITLVIAAGAVAWHHLNRYNRDKASISTGETIGAFEVTVICSHPGTLAARFPNQARIRVVYRGDDRGLIDDEMADQIVAAVNNHPSFVWVDESGFRVAPAR